MKARFAASIEVLKRAVALKSVRQENDGYSQPASGLKWTSYKPTGKEQAKHELTNDELRDALKEKNEFTEDEWRAFGIKNLRMNHFIKSGDSHFKPTEPEHELGETGLPLRWEDVWPLLDMIDSVEELEEAVRNPQQFMVRLFARALAPMLLRAAVPKARPILEPHLQRLGVRWEEDAVPMLEAIDSVESFRRRLTTLRDS